jgi:pyruvate dehydrogenase (quinone)
MAARHKAIHDADLLLMLGTDFPFTEFLPHKGVKKVQIDKNPRHIDRRTAVDLGLIGDVKATLRALLERIPVKSDGEFLEKVDTPRSIRNTWSRRELRSDGSSMDR